MLEDAVRRPRAARHQRESQCFARVLRVNVEEHYGFVETTDGLEVYFHENSVLDGRFQRLQPGDKVRVVVNEGESTKGPQASTVVLVS